LSRLKNIYYRILMPVQQQPESIFNQLDAFGHKKVVFCSDPDTGLKAIIAIHDTTLGPAFGSTRMWSYKTEADALNDVLRLSKSMTYKCAIAGLNMGGGYSVIIGDSRKDKTEALMRKFGRFIKNLNGEFITSEDVGTSPRDMEYIRMETSMLPAYRKASEAAAIHHQWPHKVFFMGIKACVKEQFGSDSLTGKSVIVQGVGHVGEHLVRLLRDENVKVYVSDIQEERIGQIAKKYGAQAVSNNSIFDIDADIYAPCALGGTINTQTINKLKCSIIAGSANNQLLDEAEHGACF
jgi:leucine dehydrogenase